MRAGRGFASGWSSREGAESGCAKDVTDRRMSLGHFEKHNPRKNLFVGMEPVHALEVMAPGTWQVPTLKNQPRLTKRWHEGQERKTQS